MHVYLFYVGRNVKAFLMVQGMPSPFQILLNLGNVQTAYFSCAQYDKHFIRLRFD